MLQIDEELPVLRQIGDIHEDAHQFVAVLLPLVRPLASNGRRFARSCSKPLLQLKQRINDQIVRHWAEYVAGPSTENWIPCVAISPSAV